MTPLPPLPLVDGAFLIDNTALEHFQSCRRLYELQDLRRYTLTASRAGRNFGSCLHVGLKVRYSRCGPHAPTEADMAAINDAMTAYMNDNPPPVDDFRTAEHAIQVMKVYCEVYGEEPFQLVPLPSGEHIVERSFALPLGEVQNVPIIYTGRVDLEIETNDGLWNFDHKTTFMFGTGFEDEMAINGGQLGYVWAMRQVLRQRVNGYFINAIRVRRPTQKGAPVDPSDFKRIPTYVSDDSIDEWKRDTLNLVSDIFFSHDRGYYPKSRRACVGKYGRCDFYECCVAPEETRAAILESQLFEENKWTPLNPTKEREKS